MKNVSLTIGIIVIIFLIAWALLVWQKGENGQIVPPKGNDTPPTTIQPPDGNNTENPPQNGEIPAGWKTYRNEELGFQLAYPGEWFLYDRETFLKDDGGPMGGACGATGGVGMEGTLALSRKDIGSCVDLTYDGAPVLDITIKSFLSPTQTPLDFYIDQPGRVIITIDGIYAEKIPTLSTTTIEQRANVTSIGFSRSGKNYTIYFSQTDRNGTYDPVYDQILSTFRFLD